jgi:hypothetical protein
MKEYVGMTQPPDTHATPFLFFCDLSALSREQRAAHIPLSTRLFGSLVQETRELPDGYAFRFDGAHYPLLADFVTNERRCCPFFSFRLDVAPFAGPVWLHLTAEGDVKAFIREEIGQAFHSSTIS